MPLVLSKLGTLTMPYGNNAYLLRPTSWPPVWETQFFFTFFVDKRFLPPRLSTRPFDDAVGGVSETLEGPTESGRRCY